MAFPSHFLDTLRDKAGLADVVSKRVKLLRKGHEYQGLCPFHNEKTPSFTINEEKGFYHCFGCGAHGSIFDFIMETQGISFREAVEQLAGQIGMRIPVSSPEEREHDRNVQTLLEVCELATKYFEKKLHSAEGERALKYLTNRGLKEDTIKLFRLGFAPKGWNGLKEHLISQKIPEKLLIDAGLIIQPEKSPTQRTSYDRFRDRIIFPIIDRREKVIAFGGRIIDRGEPKYLNSPETPLFIKRRALYGVRGALEASRKNDQIIVVEGYMDVVALYQFNLKGAVAPLGTALTVEQMTELWRISPRPILCFDGDSAGKFAAARAAKRALPIIKAGQELEFALLPEGEDPDSLIRSRGLNVFNEFLEKTLPLSEIIWRLASAGSRLETPEEKATAEKKLSDSAREIQDKNFRQHFIQFFRRRLWDRRRQGQRGRQKNTSLANGGQFLDRMEASKPSSDLRREQVLLATLINYPELFDELEEKIGSIKFSSHELDIMRQRVLKTLAENKGLNAISLTKHLKSSCNNEELNTILCGEVYTHAGFARPNKSLEEARKGWFDTYRLISNGDLRAQIRSAERAWLEKPSSEAMDRLRALKEQ